MTSHCQANSQSSPRRPATGILTRGLLLFSWACLAVLPGAALGSDLADEPMETKIQSPPANIMFLLDNSGSMDWETMTKEPDGQFHGAYYVYTASDNIFGTSSYPPLSGSKMIEWKSQWSGYNTLFYNPHSNYHPWSRWERMASTKSATGVAVGSGGTPPPHEADLRTPRSNPVDNTPTVDLHATYYSNLPVKRMTIVDNLDGAPAFTTSGFTNESSLTPEWKNSAVYTSLSGSTAVFKPNIPQTGKYQIYAWWNCYTGRDRNALITVDSDGNGAIEAGGSQRKDQHATADNVPEAGRCGEWLPLFNGTAFTFPAGQAGKVTITRDASSTAGTTTIADAIAFVGGTINVKNAHYYAVNDADGDDVADPGEAYLVNFGWTDSNGNGKVDPGEVLREYYLVEDNGAASNHEVVTAVTPVVYDPASPATDQVPDAIQPREFDDFGTPVGFVSDYADLQNFANWFSFYRRRELLAKGSVSLPLVDLDRVQVGYYTINTGVRQPVLPINVASSISVIVDNQDSTFTKSSNWSEGGRKPEWKNSSLQASSSGKWAQWKPNITYAGDYNISAWWSCSTSWDQKAKFTITHAGGSTVKYLNQRASKNDTVTTKPDCTDPSGSGCCGEWVPLGTYTLNAGTAGQVRVERHAGSTGSYTTADAVKFEGVESVVIDSTNILLDKLYSVDSNGSTPLRTGLHDIGRYFDMDDGNDGNLGDSPYYTEAEGGTCQQAYTIAMTDGYWNDSYTGVGNADNNQGAPYQDSYSNTLADVAMYYYNRDLANTLIDELPTNNYDKKKTQHMVTFSISIGLEGSIPLDDMNKDGIIDDPGYSTDPYFLDPDTPYPTWGNPTASSCSNCSLKIDDLWHASINGRGQFFVATDSDTLVQSLHTLFADISARNASGASVSVNGDELSTGLVLYQSTYNSGTWTGDVSAFPIDPSTGEVLKDDAHRLWSAQAKLQDTDWDSERNIITYTGTPGQGVPFRYASLAPAQQQVLSSDATMVDYLRGNENDSFRSRTKKLGDIVHSAPLLYGKAVKADTDGIDNDEDGKIDEAGERKGATIFAGGNDGMLHAFDAQSGRERFAYIPLHAFDYLDGLADKGFEHRFYVDGTPFATEMTFLVGDRTKDKIDNDLDGTVDEADENYGDNIDNDGDGDIDEPSEKMSLSLLVGGLKKGGKGIYALDITHVDDDSFPLSEATLSGGATSIVRWEYPPVPSSGLRYIFAGDQTMDGKDNDGDGYKDADLNEPNNGITENYSDGIDNDGDGVVDEEGERALYFDEPDMGYSFSDPFIARSYKSYNEALSYSDNPWVVIFGNGYDSVNGHAVLYVLDAWTGTLIRKIDTGVGANNGLSTAALVDVDNDRRVDYAYAGDLMGNLWKFDLTDRDPQNWGVAFGTDSANPAGKKRIDYADVSGTGVHDTPQPLVSIPGQPITSAPDVAFHCEKDGYMVVFGTGKFVGESDRTDLDQQTIVGIWDFDSKKNHNPANFLGVWSRGSNTLSNGTLAGVKLLEQTQIDWRQYNNNWLRTLSDNKANWYTQCDDTIDNDHDGLIDNEDPTERCIPVSPTAYAADGVDNNNNDVIDETGEAIGHAGWFVDLPFMVDATTDDVDNDNDGTTDEPGEQKLAGERVVKDVIIRNGKAIVISFIPAESRCSGGGKSIIHEMDVCDGSRTDTPSFDINEDGIIDENDLINIGTPEDPVMVPPTGILYDGMLHTPVIVTDPDEDKEREMKIFSSSSGTTEVVWERQEKTGLHYWREH